MESDVPKHSSNENDFSERSGSSTNQGWFVSRIDENENSAGNPSTLLTSESDASHFLHTNLAIQQVDEDHYLFRRGSTEVHIQTFAPAVTTKVIDDGETVRTFSQGMKMLSVLETLSIIAITVVIKLSSVITTKVTKSVVLEYLLALYAFCFLFTTYYNWKGRFFQKNHIKFSKTHKSSNRWLKGVVVLFGLAVVLKDGLEFLATIFVDLKGCLENKVLIALTCVHAAFILSQVKYLFRFSKVYFRNCSTGSSTTLMLIIATNLSSWIYAIINETVIALNSSDAHQSAHSSNSTSEPTDESSYVHPTNTSAYTGACECHSSFCNAVHVAEKFLFPFLIEFSLVASCLLAVTWSNIEKQPPPCEHVVKPSYKIYSSYNGVTCGIFALLFTTVIIILLGTTKPESTITLFIETTLTSIYDSFLIGLESCMMVACAIGFYLFKRIVRPLEQASSLDSVLLFLCIFSPLVLNVFSMLAAIVGTDSNASINALSVCQPLCDILQCVTQLIFVLYGLQREPITSNLSRETAQTLRRRISLQMKHRLPNNVKENSHLKGSKDDHSNKAYLKSRRSSVTSIVSALAFDNEGFNTTEFQVAEKNADNNFSCPGQQSASNSIPMIIVTPEENIQNCNDNDMSESDSRDDTTSQVKESNSEDALSDVENGTAEQTYTNDTVIRVVSETKVSHPDKLRLWLRDVIMFLLISNACLWAFMSLDGTAFAIEEHQASFYEEVVTESMKRVERHSLSYIKAKLEEKRLREQPNDPVEAVTSNAKDSND